MNLHDLALYQAMNGESGGSEFAEVTISATGSRGVEVHYVLQDYKGHNVVSEEFVDVGQTVTLKVLKNTRTIGLGSSTTYEGGTAPVNTEEGFVYFTEDGQTASINVSGKN